MQKVTSLESYYNPLQIERFTLDLSLRRFTLSQRATILVLCNRLLAAAVKLSGSIDKAIALVSEGKLVVPLAMQSRQSVAERTYNRGFQGTVKRFFKSSKFNPNASKRMLQKAVGTLMELGGIVAKHSNGAFKVPYYEIHIPTLLVLCECCEKALVREWDFWEFPKKLRWLPKLFYKVFQQPYNRDPIDDYSHVPGYHATLQRETEAFLEGRGRSPGSALRKIFPVVTARLSELSAELMTALKKYCLPSVRVDGSDRCVYWDSTAYLQDCHE